MSSYADNLIDGVMFAEDVISRRVAELGAAIASDHAGHEVVLVTVLKGGLMFLADLCRAIDGPVRLDFMSVAGYGQRPGHAVQIVKDLDEDIEGAHVLVVEDIIDTGLTLNYLLGLLRVRRPTSLEVCVLLDRDVRRIADLPIAYRGFRMPDRFAVGYGLDYRGLMRNLPFIAALRDEVVSGEAGER